MFCSEEAEQAAKEHQKLQHANLKASQKDLKDADKAEDQAEEEFGKRAGLVFKPHELRAAADAQPKVLAIHRHAINAHVSPMRFLPFCHLHNK